MTAHWGVPDPAPAVGSDPEIALAFNDAYRAGQLFAFDRAMKDGTAADIRPNPTVTAVISIIGVGLPSASIP